MKISKKRLREILSEEIQIFIKENSHPGPNYSPKLGVTLVQFMDDLSNNQLTDVKFVKEEGDKMIFSTTTPLGNENLERVRKEEPSLKIVDNPVDDTRLMVYAMEEGVIGKGFDKDVDVKSTGEYSDMTIAELKKKVKELKKENDKYKEDDKKVPKSNLKKMGQLLFAIRAKQGWKKGEGSTGV